MAQVLGIQTVANSSMINADFPFTISEVANKLGWKHWSAVPQVVERIMLEKKVSIKASDNRFHVAIKIGKSIMHKYSKLLVDLLPKVKKGDPYDLT